MVAGVLNVLVNIAPAVKLSCAGAGVCQGSGFIVQLSGGPRVMLGKGGG